MSGSATDARGGTGAHARLQARANAAVQRRDWVDAAGALRELAAIAPRSARTWIDLSYAESFLGHYRAAHLAICEALDPLPDDPADLCDLVARLRTFNEASAIRAIAQSLLLSPSADAGVLSACVMQLSNLNDHALALRCAEAAVFRAPQDIQARMLRGQQYAQHARLDEAAADFEWALQRVPGMGFAWWSLARLRKQTADSNHVQALSRLVAQRPQAPANLAAAAFALHKELDDLGDHDGAWRALVEGCAAKRSLLSYDKADTHRLVDALVGMPVAAPAAMQHDADRTPIFIVGMHRSGTTLLEQLLDGSPQVRGVGELYDFTSAMRDATDHHCRGVIDETIVARAASVDFTRAGNRYLDGMAWRLGDERFFTDKLPSNFLNIGFICRALPHARILHMVRDPVETCFSNLRELFAEANPYAYDQGELADYFLQYRRLMAHWHAVYPGRILDVSYAALTLDPQAAMREVAAFCGIDYVDAMADPRNSTRAVSTASIVQVRDRVVRRDVPKWAPYARQLAPLIESLRAGGVELLSPGRV